MVLRRNLPDHVANLGAVERGERDQTVMGTHPPGWPKLRPGSDKKEQRRQRSALGNAPQKIKRRRISPVRIFDCEHQELPPERIVSHEVIHFFGMRYRVPVVTHWAGTVIAANVGGAV